MFKNFLKYKFLLNFILIVFLLSWAVCLYAVKWYVRPNSANYGISDGKDWNNAFSGLPDILIRGDTYYLAGGVYYGGYVFDDEELAQTYIFIKKAGSTECSDVKGWHQSFENEQVVFMGAIPGSGSSLGNVLRFKKGYYVVDGSGGGETEVYGIKVSFDIDNPAKMCTLVANSIGSETFDVSKVEFSYIEFVNAGASYDVSQICIDWSGGPLKLSSFILKHSYLHDTNHFLRVNGNISGNTLIENNYFKDNWSSSSHHGEAVIALGNNGIIFRNNLVENGVNGTGGIMVTGTLENYPDAKEQNWMIYNNIFTKGDAGNGLFGSANSTENHIPIVGWKIYSNTIVECSGRLFAPYNFAGNEEKNNLYFGSAVNLAGGDPAGNGGDRSYNFYSNCSSIPSNSAGVVITSEDPFVDRAGKNFHLDPYSTVVDAGTELGGLYQFDKDGHTRPYALGWDIGAYEFTTTGSDSIIPLSPRELIVK